MINAKQFMMLVVRPTIYDMIKYYGNRPTQQDKEVLNNATMLLMRTAMVESDLHYIKQLGSGPAIGLYQMEPTTHNDIHNNFLAFRQDEAYYIESHGARRMLTDLKYATQMCRIHYLRVPHKIPDADDMEAQGEYWKRHYNTHLGKGDINLFIDKANYLDTILYGSRDQT